MSLDPSKPSRFGGSKVRTGCLTCVKRHLKCDEDYQAAPDGRHPSCRRCAKGGRVCQPRGQDRSASTLRIVQYAANSVTRPPHALPAKTTMELRSLEYFRLRTAPELSGVHNPELWSYHIMQLATVEPALWSAITALGAVHEHFEQNSSVGSRSSPPEYALTQYGKAIKQLCESMKNATCASKDTPLLACALFSAFESIGFHLHSALSHITSGLKVLAEFKAKENWSEGARTSLRLLFPVFTRLDTQRLELGDASFPSHQPLNIGHWKNLRPPVNDFPEARYLFDNVLNELLHHIKHIEQQDTRTSSDPLNEDDGKVSGLHYAIQSYLHWTSSFEKVLSSMQSTEDIYSALLLQIWRLLFNILLRFDLRMGEMGFDKYHYDFELMVSLAEEFVCWSAHFAGPPSSLLTPPAPSPPEEKLPDKLRRRHTVNNCQGAQRSGFMGICCQLSEAQDITEEAVFARLSTERLLQFSASSRAENLEWLSNVPVNPETTIKPTFTFSHGIIYPLYVVMSRCRDPTIRRKAWTVMYRCRRREGLWDSSLAARLGQRFIQIEETQALTSFGYAMDSDRTSTTAPSIHLSSQIPNWCRVRMLRPTFLPNRKSIERYYFGWPDTFKKAAGIEDVWVEEEMEW